MLARAGQTSLKSVNRTWGPHGSWLALASHADRGVSLPQEDARTDAVDSVVRDIQNTQCLLNVEHLSAGCPHVTLQFADSKGDVGLGLVKEGLVMVEVRKEKQFQKVVRAADAGCPSHLPPLSWGHWEGTAPGARGGVGHPPSCCSCWGKIMDLGLLGFKILKANYIPN